jgi:hypothetical protein
VRLLTPKEAAALLADALGWPVKAGDVKDAVKRGRLKAEDGPGRNEILIPEAELLRLIEEHGKDAAENRARAEEQQGAIWDLLPKRSSDFLWRVNWKRRSRGAGGAGLSTGEAPKPKTDNVAEAIQKDLERLERKRKAKGSH